jgi:hypothetical protein
MMSTGNGQFGHKRMLMSYKFHKQIRNSIKCNHYHARHVTQLVQRLGYWLDGRCSIPYRGDDEIFYFRPSVQSALRHIQPPIQWVHGSSFTGGKAAGALTWPRTSIYCRD